MCNVIVLFASWVDLTESMVFVVLLFTLYFESEGAIKKNDTCCLQGKRFSTWFLSLTRFAGLGEDSLFVYFVDDSRYYVEGD